MCVCGPICVDEYVLFIILSRDFMKRYIDIKLWLSKTLLSPVTRCTVYWEKDINNKKKLALCRDSDINVCIIMLLNIYSIIALSASHTSSMHHALRGNYHSCSSWYDRNNYVIKHIKWASPTETQQVFYFRLSNQFNCLCTKKRRLSTFRKNNYLVL